MTEADGPATRHSFGWRSLLGKVALVFAGLMLGLCVFEVSLRVAGRAYKFFAFRADPNLGWVLRPDVSGLILNGAGWVFLRTNHEGMRDVEHKKIKPKGVFRIAMLGDSFTEGAQVPIRKTFWWRIESKLRQCPALAGRRAEVINFGVEGYGPAQELITLSKRVPAYSPDAVILLVCPDNDLMDNSPVLDKLQSAVGPRPYFQLHNGRLEVDDSFRKSARYADWLSVKHGIHQFLSDHLRLVALIDNVRSRGVTLSLSGLWNEIGPKPRDSDYLIQSSPGGNDLYAEAWRSAAVSGKAGSAWLNTWRTFRKILVKMRDQVRDRDALFLVAIASSWQVYPDPKARALFQHKWGITDPFSINHRIQSIGREHGFEVLDLGRSMQSYADAHHAYLHGFGARVGSGHWNSLGHQVAGDVMAAKICEMIQCAGEIPD